MAYSLDYIKRAVAYKQEGHTLEQLREAFNIPHKTFYQWEKNLENGYYDTKPKRERKRKIDREKLRQAVADRPDAYLRELAEQFGCSPQAVFVMLRKLDITLKKRPLLTPRNQRSSAVNTTPGLRGFRLGSAFM
jgi:transposase